MMVARVISTTAINHCDSNRGDLQLVHVFPLSQFFISVNDRPRITAGSDLHAKESGIPGTRTIFAT